MSSVSSKKTRKLIFKQLYNNKQKIVYACKIALFDFAIKTGYLLTGFNTAFAYLAVQPKINILSIVVNTHLLAYWLLPISILLCAYIAYKAGYTAYQKLKIYENYECNTHRQAKRLFDILFRTLPESTDTTEHSREQSKVQRIITRFKESTDCHFKPIKPLSYISYAITFAKAIFSSFGYLTSLSTLTGLSLISFAPLASFIPIPSIALTIFLIGCWAYLCSSYASEAIFIRKAKKTFKNLNRGLDQSLAAKRQSFIDQGIESQLDDSLIRSKNKELVEKTMFLSELETKTEIETERKRERYKSEFKREVIVTLYNIYLNHAVYPDLSSASDSPVPGVGGPSH